VIAEPLSAAAVQDTTADASTPSAETDPGAPGTGLGVTAVDAAEAGPVPTLFVAVTVNE
jgi:hypothetical protein